MKDQIHSRHLLKIILGVLIIVLEIILLVGQKQNIVRKLVTTQPIISLKGDWKKQGSTYTTVLPKNLKEGQIFEINGFSDDLTVKVGSQIVYQSKGNNAATSLIWINLPAHSANQTLNVSSNTADHLLRTLNQATSIGFGMNLQRRIFWNNLYALIFFVFALIVAVVFFYMVIVATIKHTSLGLQSALNLGFFVLCAGIWCLTDSQLLQFVTSQAGLVAMISAMAFFIMPIFFMRFLKSLREEDTSIEKFEMLFVVNFIIAMTLHLTNVVSIYDYVIVHHLLFLGTSIYLIRSFLKERSVRNRHVAYSCMLYFTCRIASLICYYFNRHSRLYAMWLAIGVLILSLGALMAWLNDYLEKFQRLTENELYRKLAYVDSLTGVYNRAAFERDVKTLKSDDQITFVMFDVNGLKATNDQYGHEMGDLLIQTVASIMTTAFERKGTLYRIGGDEFLVILKNVSVREVDRMLKKYCEAIESTTIGDHLTVSAAYGVASTIEGICLDDLYKKADDRMYECKRENHLGRVFS